LGPPKTSKWDLTKTGAGVAANENREAPKPRELSRKRSSEGGGTMS